MKVYSNDIETSDQAIEKQKQNKRLNMVNIGISSFNTLLILYVLFQDEINTLLF